MSIEVPIIILILAIPIYFISKWILRKRNVGNSDNRKYLAVIPTVFISPIIYISIIYLFVYSISYYPSNDFDKHTWASNPEERFKMSENIIDSEILIGKTKSDIIELLGSDFYIYTKDHIAYNIGFVPGLFNIDPSVLDIYFEDGRVIKVKQHET